jgi:hypothetical protein
VYWNPLENGDKPRKSFLWVSAANCHYFWGIHFILYPPNVNTAFVWFVPTTILYT